MSTVIKVVPKAIDVKNFPHDKKAKIIYDRVNNVLRVVVRHYYWDSEAERGKEKREYIGYVVDNVYYATDEYRKHFKRNGKPRLVPKATDKVQTTTKEFEYSSLSSSLAAELPIYHAIAGKIGLVADLTACFGKKCADMALSIAYHWLHTASNAAYLYQSWAPGKLLPSTVIPCSREMSEFFEALSMQPGWRKDFFGARVARLPEDEILAFDATEVATEAANISYAQFGLGKEGGYQKQVGMILLVGHRSGMPVLFRLLPGQITDVSTVQDMLFRFDEITDKKRVFAAVLDRGYFSLENLGRFINAKSNVIVAAKTDSKWIKDAIEEVLPRMWQHSSRIPRQECWGSTVAKELKFPDGNIHKVWVHVYRSDAKSHTENTAFYRVLDAFENDWANWRQEEHKKDTVCPLLSSPLLKYFKKPKGEPGKCRLETDCSTIDAATQYFGFFCNVSTMKCTAADALDIYQTRDVIEKTFKGGKTDIEIDVARAHKDNTLEGRFLIGFVAMSILCELRRLMRQPTKLEMKKGGPKEFQPLANEMTVNELKNRLSSIRLLYNGSGQKRWLEVTAKQHEIAQRLGFPGLYETIPDWVP